jgi:hypothetical protein
MKTVWVWTADELDRIGSGRRRVKVTAHPRKKGWVKVYPVHDETAWPHVMRQADFDKLVVEV